jgi:uncharacterized protein YjbI with pentapeptide repeats
VSSTRLGGVLRTHETWVASGWEIGRRADLRGSDLRDADLHRADLHDADLRDADLTDTDLRGANLRRARGLDHRQVRRARIDSATRLPLGLID